MLFKGNGHGLGHRKLLRQTVASLLSADHNDSFLLLVASISVCPAQEVLGTAEAQDPFHPGIHLSTLPFSVMLGAREL